MLEYLAYATLLIGLPLFLPAWIAFKFYTHEKRYGSRKLAAVIFSFVAAISCAVAFGYVGLIGSIYLACAIHDDGNCEYIPMDMIFDSG